LISDEAWQEFLTKQERQEGLKKLLERTRASTAMIESIHCNGDVNGTAHVGTGVPARGPQTAWYSPSGVADRPAERSSATVPPDLSSAIGQPLSQLLKRPEITIEELVPILRDLAPEFFADDARRTTNDGSLPSALRNELKSVETEIKYEGYLLQQQRAMDRLKKSEQHFIPDWFDYKSVSGLSREMQEKLSKVRPRTIGQASRIPGVTPAAVSLVNVYIVIQARRREQATAL
jgi:hypothetical protein